MSGALDFSSITTAKAEERARLLRALAGMPEPDPDREPEPQNRRACGFDGGARPVPPAPPPSHEETLLEILRTRSADTGGRWFE
jgi:hypothetical protein